MGDTKGELAIEAHRQFGTMLADIERQIEATYGWTADAVYSYAEHVWAGHDPSDIVRLEHRDKWVLARPYCMQIANSYRLSVGKPCCPWSPMAAYPYRLFDFMQANIGEWFPTKVLRAKIFNHQIRATLHQTTLLKAGFKLEQRGSEYRLVAVDNAQS